jgi:hypothetical protein
MTPSLDVEELREGLPLNGLHVSKNPWPYTVQLVQSVGSRVQLMVLDPSEVEVDFLSAAVQEKFRNRPINLTLFHEIFNFLQETFPEHIERYYQGLPTLWDHILGPWENFVVE